MKYIGWIPVGAWLIFLQQVGEPSGQSVLYYLLYSFIAAIIFELTFLMIFLMFIVSVRHIKRNTNQRRIHIINILLCVLILCLGFLIDLIEKIVNNQTIGDQLMYLYPTLHFLQWMLSFRFKSSFSK